MREGDSNLRFLRDVLVPRARKAGAKIQWGGGVRDDASLQAVLEAGADRAIVGTKAIRDWDWLADRVEPVGCPTIQVSLLPPPCELLTTSEPSRRATRVNPPWVT